MDELLVLLFQLFGELILQVVLEIIWEFVTSLYQAAFGRANWSRVAAALGLFIAGCAIGALSLAFWPERVLMPGPVPGLSLILAPCLAGAAMHGWGRVLRARGHAASSVASFGGGAAFAFGTALVRFVGSW